MAVMQRAISMAAAAQQPFHLQLTGGEPTLVPALIQKAAALAKGTGRCRSIGIQTNGTCLTPELLELFKTHGVQVGVSLDGPPPVHQQQRGMAAETLRGVRLLESADIPFGVTAVVTQANAAVLDRLVLALAGFGCARGIGLDLLVSKGRAQNPGRVAPADRHSLRKGMEGMVTALNAVNSRRTIPIRLRERDLVMTVGEKKRSAFCHACLAESMAVAPDGRIFPCGQTLGDPRFSAGTVWAPRFHRLKTLAGDQPQNARCNTCPLEAVCPGDCPSRLHYNQNEKTPQVCDLYQILWQMEKDHPGNNRGKGIEF